MYQAPTYHHLLQADDLHFDEWFAIVASAALMAVLVAFGAGIEMGSLLGDPNLAP